MKIHIHTPSFFPKLVGMTYATDAHARILTDLGADVTVWVSNQEDCYASPSHPYAVRSSNISGSGLPWSRLNGDIDCVLRNAEKSKPHIILTEGWYTPATLLLPRLRAFCRHAVLASHGSADVTRHNATASELVRTSAYRFAEKFSRRKILDSLSAAVILSNYQQNVRFADIADYRRYNIPTFVCPNFSFYKPKGIPRKLGASRHLVHIGEMHRNKNQEFGVTILSKLPDIYDLTFIYPQETTYSVHIKNLVRRQGLEKRVKYIVGKSREDLDVLMDNFDLLLILSYSEAQPIVAVDATAKGIPFVSKNVGCMTEFAGGIISTETNFVGSIEKIFESNISYSKYSESALKYYTRQLSEGVAKKSMSSMIDALRI